MPIGKYFGRARQSFLFWFFFFFFLLSLQLLRWMPNPPWTSGEVPAHEATYQVGSVMHSSAEFLVVPAVMAQRVIKTQKSREGKKKKKKKVWTCWGRRFPGGSPPGHSGRAREGHTSQRSISLRSILGLRRGRALGSQAGGYLGAPLCPRLPSPPAHPA